MIYHHPTHTIIVTPPKCGSTTLEIVSRSNPDCTIIYGPAPWSPDTECSKHCLCFFDLVDSEFPIDRKLLLIRDPLERVPSLYRHATQRDGLDLDFGDFLDSIMSRPSIQFGSPCVDYLPDFDWLIRTNHLRDDVMDLIGVDIGDAWENRSLPQPVEVTEQQRDRIAKFYAADIINGNFGPP